MTLTSTLVDELRSHCAAAMERVRCILAEVRRGNAATSFVEQMSHDLGPILEMSPRTAHKLPEDVRTLIGELLTWIRLAQDEATAQLADTGTQLEILARGQQMQRAYEQCRQS